MGRESKKKRRFAERILFDNGLLMANRRFFLPFAALKRCHSERSEESP
jgi:hypothetical protein